eukprot:SAG31_NODE_5224_length_2664_cov_1.890448_1_plen_93_part_00
MHDPCTECTTGTGAATKFIKLVGSTNPYRLCRYSNKQDSYKALESNAGRAAGALGTETTDKLVNSVGYRRYRPVHVRISRIKFSTKCSTKRG